MGGETSDASKRVTLSSSGLTRRRPWPQRTPTNAEAGIAVKLQLDLPDGARIGPGKIRLLELIQSEGSLSRAATAMNISYRRAWLFVQQINAAFREPAIATPEHGHGGAAARLTEFGQELIRRYRDMETGVERGSVDTLEWLRHNRSSAQ